MTVKTKNGCDLLLHLRKFANFCDCAFGIFTQPIWLVDHHNCLVFMCIHFFDKTKTVKITASTIPVRISDR